jgi:hypothetical protein
MVNWKTSLMGVIAFFAFNSELVGVPPKISHIVAGVAIAAGLHNAKDKDVTGAKENARRME